MRPSFWALGLAALAAASCAGGSGNPGAPSGTPDVVSGVWSGEVTLVRPGAADAVVGLVTVTLTRSDAQAFSGPLVASHPWLSFNAPATTVTVTPFSHLPTSVSMTGHYGTCASEFTSSATLTADHLSGDFTHRGCNGQQTYTDGRLSLSRARF